TSSRYTTLFRSRARPTRRSCSSRSRRPSTNAEVRRSIVRSRSKSEARIQFRGRRRSATSHPPQTRVGAHTIRVAPSVGKRKEEMGFHTFPDYLTRRSPHTSQGCPLRYAVTRGGIGGGDQPGVFPRPPITEVASVQADGPTTYLGQDQFGCGHVPIAYRYVLDEQMRRPFRDPAQLQRDAAALQVGAVRSEERRVGKERVPEWSIVDSRD